MAGSLGSGCVGLRYFLPLTSSPAAACARVADDEKKQPRKKFEIDFLAQLLAASNGELPNL
jgi:hypothetical protein